MTVAERRLSDLFWILSGTIFSAAIAVFILSCRGEFWPFLDTIKENFAYANGELVTSTSIVGKAFQHLLRTGAVHVAGIVAMDGVLMTAIYAFYIRGLVGADVLPALIAGSVSLISATLILISTGLFEHHILI